MSLFTIDVSRLLGLPVGSIEEFHFDQEIPADTWEDLICTEPLVMDIKVIREDFWISCLLQELTTTITIPSEGIESSPITLEHVSREFHLKKKNEDTDDIEYIDMHDVTIDLSNILEQELLIAGF